MTLILKQVYEEKEVEVGIWRTLGAGGLAMKRKNEVDVELVEKGIGGCEGRGGRYRSQF
jgi:hypothetical protein